MKNLIDEIVNSLTDYAKRNNYKSFVIGISGEVESAVASTLCAKTGFPTIGVILPCESKEDWTKRCVEHMFWLKCKFPNAETKHIDLTSTFQHYKNVLTDDLHNPIVFDNTKNRLRKIAIYQISDIRSGLVVGTWKTFEDHGNFEELIGQNEVSPIIDISDIEINQMAMELGIVESLLG